MSLPAPGSRGDALTGQPISRWSGLALALGLGAVGVSAYQVFALSVGWLNGAEAYAGTILLPLLLFGLVVLGARLEGRPLREYGFLRTEPAGPTLLFAGLLVGLYTVLEVDTGFVFGFGRVPPLPPALFGVFLLSAPLVALGNVGLFFGFVQRNLSRALSLRVSILASASLYALCSTSVPAAVALGSSAAVPYLLTTTAVSLVLGIAIAFYVYKARWGLLGPFTFLTGVTAVAVMLPVGVTFPSWETAFAASLLAVAVVLVVTGLGLEEPHWQARKYLGETARARRHRVWSATSSRHAFRETLVVAAVVGVAAISVSYGLPIAMNTPQPLLAIATGSMVPALERGDMVVLGHAAASAITVGTIIAFSVSCLPSPTVHRVIKIVSTGPNWVFQTKGDANPSQDPCTVPYHAVLGVVLAVIPVVGYLILDPLFAVAIVAVAVLVPVLWGGRRT